ncbi:GNAT family N-acetyltransferase [Cytobacillus spongiae]|uniref:GNAT family N-acetyltransferase n=1 Tax=Cytobacillus spongiae TaxID=2901381 RepID=UPI001F44BA3A|nr:GNAT family N-acetyltransferase [Cytobacillus spongiae]UII56783.1 GNAT family N-acetyltransferase [Cytobacillus spongiae]
MKVELIKDQMEMKGRLQTIPFHEQLNRFRPAENQQMAMIKAIERGNAMMTLAVSGHYIVGYTIILPPEEDERWHKLPYLKMVGVMEVAPSFRNLGLGKRLIQGLFEEDEMVQSIIVSLEYCWHWDLGMTDGDPLPYSRILKNVLKSAEFIEFETTDPDIALYETNFMMARIGSSITAEQYQEFKKLAKQ